jgi:hypothetical protein
VTVTL